MPLRRGLFKFTALAVVRKVTIRPSPSRGDGPSMHHSAGMEGQAEILIHDQIVAFVPSNTNARMKKHHLRAMSTFCQHG